jgi:glycine cleavage system regulatory protein
MFRATARLRVPSGLGHADIATDLEQLGNELIVDLAPAADAASPRKLET